MHGVNRTAGDRVIECAINKLLLLYRGKTLKGCAGYREVDVISF